MLLRRVAVLVLVGGLLASCDWFSGLFNTAGGGTDTTQTDNTDTDGDGWEDGYELSVFDSTSDPYRFNPRVADLPRLQVEFEDSPEISMQYTTTEGNSETFTTSESESFSTAHSASNSFSHSYAAEYGWSLSSSFGVEHTTGFDDNGTTISWSITAGTLGPTQE